MTEFPETYSSVSLRSILRFLSARGWSSKKSNDGRVTRVYLAGDSAKNEEDVELFFTDANSPKIRQSELQSALQTIAEFYEMPIRAASQAVGAIAFDLILSRIPDEYVRHDSVELRLATKYMQSMKDFLAASATTELSQETSFKRTLKEAIEYAGACRFGHTFKGSFGFVIESPVGLNDTPVFPALPAADDQVPFNRKVVERIIRGFDSYEVAISEDDPSAISRDAGTGFSANMCEAVAGVLEETEVSKIDLSIRLSPEWRWVGDERRTVNFSVERRYVDILREAAAKLRKTETPQVETVVGRIIKLEAEGNPSDLLSGASSREVVISWDSNEYGYIRVSVPLTPQGYLEALTAHKEGQIVSVTGLLKRKGRSWEIDGANGMRVLQ